MNINSIRELLEQLSNNLNDKSVTAYRVNIDTGVPTATVYKLRDNPKYIDDVTLVTAEKLAKFQLDRNRK